MTDMKRVTISMPEELDQRVIELKKDDRFVRASYSEVVRYLLQQGLQRCDEAVPCQEQA